MDGVALCARFSIATNRLAYCGPADAEPQLYRAIVTGEGTPAARTALARFEALMPYLEAIAAANGRDPFDLEVVRAYWIGNDLLRAVDRGRFLELLTALTRRGLPPSVARRLAEHLPAQPFAHHMFHVSYVGVGAVTGHVPTTVANLEACRPAWAKVVAVTPDLLTIEGPTVREAGGRIDLGGLSRRVLAYDARVLPGVAVGGTVAVHWSWPAVELDAGATRDLETWTRRALASANESLPRLDVDPGPSGAGGGGATSRR